MLLAHVLTRLRPASLANEFVPLSRPVFLNRNGGASVVVSVHPRRRVHVSTNTNGGASVWTCPRGVPWRRGVSCGASVVPSRCPVLNKGKRRKQERRRVPWRVAFTLYRTIATTFPVARCVPYPQQERRRRCVLNRNNGNNGGGEINQQQRRFPWRVVSRPWRCPVYGSTGQRRRAWRVVAFESVL